MVVFNCNIKKGIFKVKIKKAVIPAGGFGTRVLPATKVLPKEMYPIVDKPAIQYVVEEAVKSGISDILIVVGRGKEVLQNHFDVAPELEAALEKSGKEQMLKDVRLTSGMANIYFTRQKNPQGLGHAILCAESFVGDEPFAVLYPDDVIYSKKVPVCKQLMDAYEEFGLGVLGAHQMPLEEMSKYGSLKVENIRDNLFMCRDMIEKPAPNQVMSRYSILGRCVLPASIFEILKDTSPGVGGEIQLTDAMKVLAQKEGMVVVDFEGIRYDIGNKLGILTAIVETALRHPELSADFKEYLKNILKDI